MPSHWLLHYWNNNPQKVDFPPKISYGEQEKTETWCQPEGKLVSQEMISHSQTTWGRDYVKHPWWDGGGTTPDQDCKPLFLSWNPSLMSGPRRRDLGVHRWTFLIVSSQCGHSE